ncbi:hypothetical protein ACP6H1_27445 [Vibrio harveyi]|uniref:hypothetical protein n=1 Tax=Vibrio harveyi TaxID=669 RepID=UPI003CE7948C
MKYTHKIGLIKFNPNGSTKCEVVTFNSVCNEYKEAVLSMVHKRPEWHDCYLYEPVTKSPVTFDITIKYITPSGDSTFNSDRYFLTCAELVDFCDNVIHEDRFVSVVTQPFCRTLFSNAGTLDEFYKFNIKGYKPKIYVGINSVFHNEPFEKYDRSVFQSIKEGVYHNCQE